MIGRTVSHYRITAKLGEGGMGEVYRAEDTTLGRDVALKMLPESFASDPERLTRFEREARLLASLSHPNIAGIHDLIEDGEHRFLVMEVAEGEDLAERIARGPVPLDQAIDIAIQIAQALEVAHEKGIVHRDLKPANVKIQPDGKVKVLDFGLAKALADDEELGEESQTRLRNSPAISRAATAAGVLLGTVGYMSPEQARGQAVDRRADIWAFGCVLHEMLTGRRAFAGNTVTDVLAAVVAKEPDFATLADDTPAPIRRLLERCLRKDPARRLQAIGDARVVLQDYLENPEAAFATVPAAHTGARLPGWVIASLVVTVIALLAWFVLGRREGEIAEPLRRLEVRMGERAFDRSLGSSVALSSDGKLLAYVTGTAGGESELHLRPLDRSESTILVKGSGAAQSPYHPFFSPDGKWLGYVTASELMKVSVTGGTPMTLASVSRSRGASWGSDGTIVFTSSPSSGLLRVSESGGTPEPLTTLDESRGESTHRWPQWLPGGSAVLFTAAPSSTNLSDASLEVLDLATGEQKVIHRGGYYGRYVRSGHIIYAHRNTLFAIPFNLNRLEVSGAPVPVVSEVAGASTEGTAHFDVSANGLLAYLAGEGPAESSQLVWVDRDGVTEKLWVEPGIYGNPRLSPDGSRLSVTLLRDNNWDVWVFDLERSVATRLTFGGGYDADQVWSPDGRWLAFASDQGGKIAIYRKRADGSGESELLGEPPEGQDWFPFSWSTDGRFLLASVASQGGDIWVLPLEEGASPEPYVATPFTEQSPAFSPDGRFVAYDSNESGRFEVYVRTFPAGGGKWQVSDGGGSQPRWSADGRRLFFRGEEGVVEVSVDTSGDGFRADRGRLLFSGSFHGGLLGITAGGFVFPDYEAAHDGSRFILLAGEKEEVSEHWLTLVTGWFAELQELAPAEKSGSP